MPARAYLHARTHAPTHPRTHARTYVLTYSRTHVLTRTYILTYVHMYVHTYIHTYIHACRSELSHGPGTARTCHLRCQRPTPYPLSHRASLLDVSNGVSIMRCMRVCALRPHHYINNICCMCLLSYVYELFGALEHPMPTSGAHGQAGRRGAASTLAGRSGMATVRVR